MANDKRGKPATSVLQQAGVDTAGIHLPDLQLSEVPAVTILRIHSLEPDTVLEKALAPTGIALPLAVNRAAGSDPAALCLRPGEWLLISEHTGPDGLRDRLTPHLDPSLTAVLDQSDGLGVFRLRGAAAAWLLGKFSGLDFLAGVRSGQHSASARIGDVAAVLHFRPGSDGLPCFDLIFDRSIAACLWAMLADAAPHAAELLATHGAAA